MTLKEALTIAGRAHVLGALTQTGGNRTAAAKLLGISRKNLWEKCRAYEIDFSRDGAPAQVAGERSEGSGEAGR